MSLKTGWFEFSVQHVREKETSMVACGTGTMEFPWLPCATEECSRWSSVE